MPTDCSVYELKGLTRNYAQYDAVVATETGALEEASVIGLNAATRKWLVYFNGATESARAQAAANPPAPSEIAELPLIGSAHPLDEAIKLTSYDIVDNGNGSATYTAHYAYVKPDLSQSPSQGDASSDGAPGAGWATVVYPARAQFDLDKGQALVLPTGEPFDDLPRFNVVGLSYTAVKNFVSVPEALLEANGCINSNSISVAGYSVAKHCGLIKVHATPVHLEDGTTQWKVSTTIEIRHTHVFLSPDDTSPTDIGHDIAVLLAGTRFYPESGGAAVVSSLLDDDGRSESVKVAKVLLLPNGKRVPQSQNSASGVAKPPAYYKQVSVYRECTFQTVWFGGEN